MCDLYDNKSDVSGQATNVFISTERNGWKELTFDIPSTCMGAEGEVENYRLKYLIAEYRIRAVTDEETDWFIISEPKISRNNFSKNVSVRAGHISQLLKHKNLDLEFSDDEGNNVGTAEAILDTILEGTDWTRGCVGEQDAQGHWHTFLEDDGSAKKRSLTAQAGTGALGLIEKLCDIFEAKPVYHGDTKTVDILPMNPFAKTDVDNIPTTLRDNNLKVMELYYDRNVHGLDKTTNAENMATRLYAYGSSGDLNGACTLQNAIHHEWECVVGTTGSEYLFAITGLNLFFQGDVGRNDVLVWSDMDLTSMSYIYNKTKNKAYKVYKTPKTQSYKTLTVSNPTEVANGFAYLLGLQYYNDVGLMTDEQFQAVAQFQREMPELYKIISQKSEEYIQGEADLSKIAEHNTGLLKLNIQSKSNNRFYINTNQNENGVIYRTDYDVAERRYFKWHVTDALDRYGDPIKGTPSLLLIVHQGNLYDMSYLKCIWDTNGMVVDDNNNPADFEYSNGNYPVSFTVWDENIRYNGSTDRVYLFCTNSMSGRLGARLSDIEAVYQDLDSQTAQHPVHFQNSLDAAITPTGADYEWRYWYQNTYESSWNYDEVYQDGRLDFCWKSKYNETTWHGVTISDTVPVASAGSNGYYYDSRHKVLYRWNGSAWVKIESQDMAGKFETVIYLCRKRDELYRGIYEYYYHNQSKAVGNYAIFDGYNGYWYFKLKASANNLLLDYINGNVYTNVTFNGNTPVIGSTIAAAQKSIEKISVTYPTDNELRGRLFDPGTIKNGIDAKTENTNYRTAFIPVSSSSTYYYRLPTNSIVFLYNSSKAFSSMVSVSTQSGSFTTGANTYIRLLVPEIDSQSYIKLGSTTADNILRDRPYIAGSINSSGQDVEVDCYRTVSSIPVYEGTIYEYSLPASCRVFYYDVNLKYISSSSLTNQAGSGQFTTPGNARNIRLISSTNNMTGYYVRVKNYNKVFYTTPDREQYTILDNVTTKGELIGITPLVKKFADIADEAYQVDLAALRQAQDSVKTQENNLAVSLGDMLKDGRWQDSNYIYGDEKRLYDDALYMLRQVSYPETTYSFTYLDMFGVKNEHYYEEHETSWPDIEITQTAHLVDPESNTNCWAYIDKINKCYDKPWETTVDIDTKLTLAARHGFTDVIARIAEVAKEMKAKQGLYDLAATGKIEGSRLEGVIQMNQVYLNGGSSNWYNDEKGNLIFEAADGLSAMQLGGRGIGISTQKQEDGSWLWRTAATGYGLTADVITTGYLSADRIDAGTITLDKLSSNVGKELEIGSNKALMLYATEDGSRPAGSLKTTDGYIEVRAGEGSTPAKINIVSGGELNLNGGNVNIYSQGTLDISSGGRFTLKSQGADSIDSTAKGLFIDSEQGVNFAGGKFKVKKNGNAMDVTMIADNIQLGQPNAAIIELDAALKTITIGALNGVYINGGSTITLEAGQALNLITKGIINIGYADNQSSYLFTIGADTSTGRAFIYNSLSSCNASLSVGADSGVYIGTDGFALKQRSDGGTVTSFIAANGSIELSAGTMATSYIGISTAGNYRIWAGHPTASEAPFSVQKNGYIFSTAGQIGGFTLSAHQFTSGSGECFFAINTDPALSNPNEPFNESTNNYAHPYALWVGNSTDSDAPFRVNRKGVLFATGARISGNVAITSGSITIQNQIGTQTFSVTADGVMTANKGTIAGWGFDVGSLVGNKVGLAKTENDTDIAIWAGAEPTRVPIYEERGGVVIVVGYKNVANSNAPFKVTQGGAITATAGSIAGWTIGESVLKGNKVGLAKTTNDSDYAIWAGDEKATGAEYVERDGHMIVVRRYNAPFRVTQGGEMYVRGATIEGSSFIVKATSTQNTEYNALSIENGEIIMRSEITKQDNTTEVIESLKITNGLIGLRAGGSGFMIDPNDFGGPYNGTEIVTATHGHVGLNCNSDTNVPRIHAGRIINDNYPFSYPFMVYSNGNIHYNNHGPAVIITSFSTESIAGFLPDANNTYIQASFFNSSRLSVAEDGTSVYATYNGRRYAASSDLYDTIYNRGKSSISIQPLKEVTASGSIAVYPDSGFQAMGGVIVHFSGGSSGGDSGGGDSGGGDSGGGNDTCFAKGTLITLESGEEVPIEDLKIEQHVLSYNEETCEFESSEIRLVQLFHNARDIYDIYFSNNKMLRLTGSHPVLTTNGWKALNVEQARKEHNDITIELLDENDIVITKDGNASIEQIVFREDLTNETVYNIDVEPVDTYIAAGVIVHNADPRNKEQTQ